MRGFSLPTPVGSYLAEGLERRFLLSAAIKFATERMFQVGSYPESVVTADVNGDGKSDLLTPNLYSNSVSVLLGNGNGTFQSEQEFQTGQKPTALAVLDVNADTQFDLAVSNSTDNTVSILLGNGNGTFQTQQTFAVGTGPGSLILKDLNNDNKPDLAVANSTAGTISVLLGNGNGTFQSQQTIAAGSVPGSLAVTDINGDGKPDLVFENSTGTVNVLLGNGNGTFQARQTLAAVGGILIVSDFNNDNKPDLAIINSKVNVLLGNGNGTFQAARTFAVGSSSNFIVASDLNGDGKTDLAVSNHNDENIGVLVGNGDGTFLPQQTVAVVTYPGYLAAADLDGDGTQDLVTVHPYSFTVGVLLNHSVPPLVLSINRATPAGPTTSGSSVSFTVTFNKPVTGVDAGDFAVPASGVTHTGLIVTPVSSSIYTVTVSGISGAGTLGLNLVGNGSIRDLSGQGLGGGPVAFAPQQTFADGTYESAIVIADVNGDGKPDLITTRAGTAPNFTDGSVSVLLGNGNGTFQAARTFAAGQDAVSVAVTDVNGDGKLDLVVADFGKEVYGKPGTPGSVSILLGNGNGTFQAQRTFATRSYYSQSVAIADINGDGKPDLVVGGLFQSSFYQNSRNYYYSAGRITVLLGNGNGTFQAPSVIVNNLPADGDFPAVADVNADKKVDLVFPVAPDIDVLLGNGNGTFQALRTFGATNYELPAVADVNGDGRADIVAAPVYPSSVSPVSVLLGLGNSNFQPAQTFASAEFYGAPVVVDMNGDGIPDVVGNTGTGIGILLGNGNGTFQSESSFAVGTGSSGTVALAIADVNGDGVPDAVLTYAAGSGSGLPDGTRSVNVLLGQPDGSFTEQVYTIVPPAKVSSINRSTPAASITGSTTLTYAVTFSSSVTNVRASDFQVVTSGDVVASLPLVVSGSGASWTVTISGVRGNGTLQLELVDHDTILDGLGTPLGGTGVFNGSFSGQVYTILQTFPTVLSINRAGPPTPTTVDNSVSFAVTFNEPVSGVDATDFTLALGGVTTTPPVVVTGSGAVYTVTVNGIGGTGTLGLNLVDDGSIRDSVGNPLQNTAGTAVSFQNQLTFAAGSDATFIAAADVNGDGRADLLVTNQASGVGAAVSVLLGNANGTFDAARTFAAGSNPYFVAVSDLNGDGKPDLAVVNVASSTVSVLLGNGNGTFSAPASFIVGNAPRTIAIADLNGDGKPDLVVGASSLVSVLMSNGDGTFQLQRTVPAGAHPFSLALADVNGDAKPDLVVADSGTDSVNVLLGNGDGTFQTLQTFATGISTQSIAVTDVNGDGQLDAVVGSGVNDTFCVLLGNGNGSFQAQRTFAQSNSAYGPVLSDVNGDSRPDLIMANRSTNTIGVLLGNGNGTFQSQQTLATGGAPMSIAMSDFNGDGRLDLAVANSASSTASVLLSNSTGSFIGQTYIIVPAAETIAGTSGNDSITLTRDSDSTDIDWSLFSSMGNSSGLLPINDPHGLTINGNGGGDTIILSYVNGNPLPNGIHLNGTFTVNGLTGANSLANTNLEIGKSTVFVNYGGAGADAATQALIKTYLAGGYNGGAWTGVPTASTGVITSTPAKNNVNHNTAIGWADSSDGTGVNTTANTIELKYTLNGDTNLNGAVDIFDLNALLPNFNKPGVWTGGDSTYNGAVDIFDLNALLPNFNTTLGAQVAPAAAGATPAGAATSSNATPDMAGGPASGLPAANTSAAAVEAATPSVPLAPVITVTDKKHPKLRHKTLVVKNH